MTQEQADKCLVLLLKAQGEIDRLVVAYANKLEAHVEPPSNEVRWEIHNFLNTVK